MSARCPVCSHDSRAAIEQALLNGKPKAQVAKTFGFTYRRGSDGKEMGNHKVMTNHLDHMGEAFKASVEGREMASGEAMAARLRVLEAEVDRVIERANADSKVKALLDEVHSTIREHQLDAQLLILGQEGRDEWHQEASSIQDGRRDTQQSYGL